MRWLKNLLIGSMLGLSNVLPGASLGTILLILGVYEEFIDSIDETINTVGKTIKNITKVKSFKEFIKVIVEGIKEVWNQQKGFIIPIVIIAGLTMYIMSKIFYDMDGESKVVRNSLFLGLILASIPIVILDIVKGEGEFKTEEKGVNNSKNTKNNKTKKQILVKVLPGILTFGLLAITAILKFNNIGLVTQSLENVNVLTIFPAFLVGIIGAIAMVFPGISGSLVITIMGYYEVMTGSIKTLNLIFLIPFALGLIIGMIYSTKALKVLFEKYNEETNFAIVGFVIGSVLLMIPEIPSENNLFEIRENILILQLNMITIKCIIATICGIGFAFGIKKIGDYFTKKEKEIAVKNK